MLAHAPWLLIAATVGSLSTAPKPGTLGTPAAEPPVRTHSASGALVLATGTMSPPLTGELLAAVRAYVEARRQELGLPVSSALGAPIGFSTRFGGAVHFPQLAGGYPVYGAKVVVTLDAQRRVYVLASSAVPYAKAVLQWTVSRERAMELAAARTPLAKWEGGAPLGGSRAMVFQVGDEVHAGYLAHVPSLDPRESWMVAVDATTGAVLWAQNRVFYAADDAQVYERSPGGLDAGVGAAPLTAVTVEHLLPGRDSGYLEGDQLVAFNCCPTQDCRRDAGSARADGSVAVPVFGMLPYDVAICQRMPLASQDPAVHDAGSFVYTPVDPARPKQVLSDGTAVVDILEPANSDPFAEVQAFYQVNKAYDFVRSLSVAAQGPFNLDAGFAPFRLRDTREGKRSAVWVNVTLPNVNEAIASGMLPLRANTLTHFDNAAFIAKENFDQFRIDAYSLDVDTIMMFQGGTADFAYDSPVLWHEFGHGVIHATAGFDGFAIDERSGNNEGGALHEAIADFISAAYGKDSRVGEYVGPRQGSGEGTLRDLLNTESCPNVLSGEVHQDSQHFSGALWDARRTLFQGADQGRTFDAAIYAALVSMTPSTDFAQAAATVAAQLPVAFPSVADAAGKMSALFAARGVTGCSKVVDVTNAPAPRRRYGVGGTTLAKLAANTVVPGPYQLRVSVPAGASSVRISTTLTTSPLAASGPRLHLLVKRDAPLKFTRAGANGLTHDAEVNVNSGTATGPVTLTAPLAVPCGGALYFTLGNSSTDALALQNVSFTVVPAASCPQDAGTPDAGTPLPPYTVASPTGTAGDAVPGCGCQSGGAGSVAAVIGLLWGTRRRRRGRTSVP